MDAFDLLLRVRDASPRAARTIAGLAIPRVIPFASGLGIEVHELDDKHVVTSLALKRRTKNHVGSMYIGAQVTLAELTMGLLLFTRWPPTRHVSLVKRMEADYLKKAKTATRAVCAPADEVFTSIDAQLAETGRAEHWIPVTLHDEANVVVTDARFLASVKKR